MDSPTPNVPDLDALWDYDHPAESERRFREFLRAAPDDGLRAETLTQIARAQGLQRQFEAAHATLDQVELMPIDDRPRVRVRYLLERGRVFNSSRQPDRAVPLFGQACDRALAAQQTALAVDALHMLAIADSNQALAWNLKALALTGASGDPQARRWLASLDNNLGWTYFDRGDYSTALAYFEKALAERAARGEETEIRIARWCIAKTLRRLDRADEALQVQLELLAQINRAGETDGYVDEEIAECLFQLNRPEEARPYFGSAYQKLSQDVWLVENEPARVERLKDLS